MTIEGERIRYLATDFLKDEERQTNDEEVKVSVSEVEEAQENVNPYDVWERKRRRRTGNNFERGTIDEFGVLKIPSKEVIHESAFANNQDLRILVLPDGLKKIEENAFRNCRNLEEVNFPEGLEFIGASAFEWCEKLRRVVIPGSVEVVQEFAFYGCAGLEKLVIKNGVRVLERGAFGRCSNLKFHRWNLPRSVKRLILIGNMLICRTWDVAFEESLCATRLRGKWRRMF